MLKYFVETAIRLVPLTLMLGLIQGYIRNTFSEDKISQKIAEVSIFLGILFSLSLGLMKNFTSKISTGMWNLRIYAVTLAAFLLFIILVILKKFMKKLPAFTISLAAGVTAIALMVYFASVIVNYFYVIWLVDRSFFTSKALLAVIGVVLGFILSLVYGISLCKSTKAVPENITFAAVSIVLLINEADQIADSFSIMLARRIIPSNRLLFNIARYGSNHSSVFIYAVIITAIIIPVVLWARSFNINEPYSNPAQRRKILAKWRKYRRWGTTVVICSVFSVLTISVINAYANRVIELSPIEDNKVDDKNFYISLEQVSDGHLHRFAHITKNNTEIRVIVIQKPNSSAYGIGLDACEICGQTGYYEREGQVVCNRCNVVMNINTIGFKGGCNPIPVEYSVMDGNIVIPLEALLKHESEFD